MAHDRRTFLRTTGTALAAAALPGPARALTPAGLASATAAGSPGGGRPGRALRILVLGGTSFIGPHQVRYALERGHEITLFNRGRTNTHLFPGVERLVGDRNGDLESLRGRRWDVCIDNSASRIRWVELSTAALRDQVDRYMYVSSRSAYADTSAVPMTADHPTFTYESAGVDRDADRDRLPYGLQKALCEREVQAVLGPERSVIFRPGLIIGPRDRTDRFTYWPVRIHRGGEVLAPGDGSDPVQIIDARDFAEWMIRMAEDGHTGVFNAVGPAVPRPMDQLLYGIRAVTTAETTFTWADTDFLLERGVRPYREMPVWRPPLPGSEGFARFDLTPEVERGLTFRPLAVTAADTLEWHFARPEEEQWPLRAGISPEQEAQVLREWHGRRG